MIIWDEAPMDHKHCFEAIDKTFRDILQFTNDINLHIPFGGKLVVLDGNFRQILPVILKGTGQQIVHATINSSYLWDHCKFFSLTKSMRLLSGNSPTKIQETKDFSNWVLKAGDGTVG